MKLRGRILLASILLVILPLMALSWFIRSGLTERLTNRFTDQVATLMEIIEEDLVAREVGLGDRLEALRSEILDDTRLRLALSGGTDHTYLLDYTGRALGLMGLDMLQIQTPRGKILSSGHFRNEFDRFDSGLPQRIIEAGHSGVLVTARRPDGDFLVLARADSFTIGNQAYYLVGGLEVDDAFLVTLSRDHAMAASLVYPGGAFSSLPQLREFLAGIGQAELSSPERALARLEYFVASRQLAFVRAGQNGRVPARATMIVSHSRENLNRLRRELDLWLSLAVGVTLVGILVMAFWFSDRLSRPLRVLASRTADLDLDRLEVDFSSDRSDEVGVLARFLDQMTTRLRDGVRRLRAAERRAVLGDLARQVNHDIRNGFTPIRNVLRHLTEVAEQEPQNLAGVFLERRGTLDSGLSYLEELARNYARLAPADRKEICDLNRIVHAVAPDAGFHLELDLALQPLPVLADAVGLRRVVENLITNAGDAVNNSGSVTVQTRVEDGSVLLRVSDRGCGIADADLDRIFTDFYTTRDEGTGLGLSIVRRIVGDCGGSVSVKSTEGEGSTFTVTLPTAPAPRENAP